MRDLLSHERAVTPATLRSGLLVLGLALAGVFLIIAANAITQLFSGRVLVFVLQLLAGFALTFGAVLLVKLISELLFAVHRLTDRIAVLDDELRHLRRAAAPQTGAHSDTVTKVEPAPAPTPAKTQTKST